MTSVFQKLMVQVGTVAVLVLGSVAHALPVVNGGFEDSSTDITGWSLVGPQDLNFVYQPFDSSELGPHGGDNVALFGSTPDTSGIEQSLATTDGHTYLVEFLLANLGGGAPSTDSQDPPLVYSVSAKVDGHELFHFEDFHAKDFTTYSFEFVAGASPSMLGFDFRHDTTWWALDDVTVTDVTRNSQIPEPGTLFLAAIALTGLGLRRYKTS